MEHGKRVIPSVEDTASRFTQDSVLGEELLQELSTRFPVWEHREPSPANKIKSLERQRREAVGHLADLENQLAEAKGEVSQRECVVGSLMVARTAKQAYEVGMLLSEDEVVKVFGANKVFELSKKKGIIRIKSVESGLAQVLDYVLTISVVETGELVLESILSEKGILPFTYDPAEHEDGAEVGLVSNPMAKVFAAGKVAKVVPEGVSEGVESKSPSPSMIPRRRV